MMLSNSSTPHETGSIPDPWTVSTSSSKSESPHPWHYQPDAHPLIPAAEPPDGILMQEGDPNAPKLAAHASSEESSAVQTLLRDELKVEATRETLGDRIRDALALLWWKATGRGSSG